MRGAIFGGSRGEADPFSTASSLGYWILVLMGVSIIFSFTVVFLRGTELTYYKNNFGTSAMNLEERAISLLTYKDPVTEYPYSKVVDLSKMQKLNTKAFDQMMGVKNSRSQNGIRLSLLTKDSKMTLANVQTSNYVEGREDTTHHLPILFWDGSNFEVGVLVVKTWKA